MAKSFKQFLEEGKSISRKKAQMVKMVKRVAKSPAFSSEKPMKVADNDTPSSSRLGGGKRITPSNWLKPSDKPNPWKQPKTPKPSKEVSSKPSAPKPEVKKPLIKPKKPGSTFAQKVDKAGEVAKQSVHAGLSRPKAIGHVVKSVAKPVLKTTLGAAKVGGSVLSSINKGIKHQAHSAASRQSKVPVER